MSDVSIVLMSVICFLIGIVAGALLTVHLMTKR